MRQLSLTLMLVGLIALSGCNSDMEKQFQDANRKIAVLEERLKGKDELIEQQEKTTLGIETSMKETLRICSAATGDENLKKQIEALSGQYTTSLKQYNDQIASSLNETFKICSAGTGDENLKKQIEALFGQYMALLKKYEETKCNPPVQTPDQPNNPSPPPYTLGDPALPNSDISNQDDMDKVLLLGAAYIACNYYSAGICGAVLAFVAQKLGMTQDEVRTKSKEAYKKLPDPGRGITIMEGPGGRPITLRPVGVPQEPPPIINPLTNPLRDLISDEDVCTIVKRYRSNSTMANFIQGLSNPLLFPTNASKANAISAAKNAGYTDLAKVLVERIGVSGNDTGVSCD